MKPEIFIIYLLITYLNLLLYHYLREQTFQPKKMEIVYEDDSIIIRLNRPKKLLEYAWKKFVSENTYKTSLERVYDTICDHDVDKCLIDRSKFSILPPHMRNWWETSWFPRIRENGIKRIAVVCSPSNNENISMVLAYLAQEDVLSMRN